MHDWRRNGNKLWGSRNEGRNSRNSRDLCWWWRWSRFGPIVFFLLDYCGLGRGGARGIVPEGLPSLWGCCW